MKEKLEKKTEDRFVRGGKKTRKTWSQEANTKESFKKTWSSVSNLLRKPVRGGKRKVYWVEIRSIIGDTDLRF